MLLCKGQGVVMLSISKVYKDLNASIQNVEVPVLDEWEDSFREYEKPYVTNLAALAWLKRGWAKTTLAG